MRKIGVLSDTHLNNVDDDLKSLFVSGPFKEVDTVIHAGDFTSVEVVNFLDSYMFYGVQGNMDDYQVREKLPDRRIETLDGVRIGIAHGWGAPFGLDQRVYEYFGDPSLQCIVFGHSHKPTNHYIGETLMFNPGSFKKSFISSRRTVGLLTIEKGKIRGEIITL